MSKATDAPIADRSHTPRNGGERTGRPPTPATKTPETLEIEHVDLVPEPAPSPGPSPLIDDEALAGEKPAGIIAAPQAARIRRA